MEYEGLLWWFVVLVGGSVVNTVLITLLLVRSIVHDRYRKKLRS